MRYFIHLAYNGKNFHGWQIQKNASSVQQILSEVLALFFKVPIELTGAGRTDAGVHATEYYAHFDLIQMIEDTEIEKIVYKLNGFLNEDIVIYNIIPVPENLHARFDAISRTYKYYINTSKNIFNTEFSYTYYGKLDINNMNQACNILFEYQDFTCFSKSNTQTKTNNCHITEAYWREKNKQLIFTITADRFLRNMVRAIVGTMIEIGLGKLAFEDMRKVIESKNRSEAGYSVPAKGLFLTRICYKDLASK